MPHVCISSALALLIFAVSGFISSFAMGAQDSKTIAPEDQVFSVVIRCESNKKYLGLYPDGSVQAKAPWKGVLERWFVTVPEHAESCVHPGTLEAEPCFCSNVQLRICGTSAEVKPNSFLIMSPHLNVVAGNESDAGSLWSLEPVDEVFEAETAENFTCNVRLRSVEYGHYVAVASSTTGKVRSVPSDAEATTFRLKIEQVKKKDLSAAQSVAKVLVPIGSSLAPAEQHIDPPPACITDEEVLEYHRVGYVVVKNVVPPEFVERAKQKIQEGLEKGIDRSKVLGEKHQNWTKQYREAQEILSLFHETPVFRCCEKLMNATFEPPKEAQIALRKPRSDGEKDFGLNLDWHIDGYEKFTTARFGVIVMVSLSDWMEDNMGNMKVFPYSHYKIEEMRAQMSNLRFIKAVARSEDLGIEPVHVHAKTGDVIFSHPLLAHDVAPNLSNQVRWAVIFRPMLTEQNKLRTELLHPSRKFEPEVR